jgi:hypothetical protein
MSGLDPCLPIPGSIISAGSGKAEKKTHEKTPQNEFTVEQQLC